MSRLQARLAGICYLLTIVVGVFAAFVPSRPAGVTSAISSAQGFLHCRHSSSLPDLETREPGTLAHCRSDRIAGCTVGALEALHRSPFSFKGIVIFGFYCVLLGYLIFRSRFFPRWLGPLVALAGLGWLTFLWPSFAKHLGLVPMLAGLVGEGSLTVCLLVSHGRNQPV